MVYTVIGVSLWSLGGGGGGGGESFSGSSMSYFIHPQLCLCLGKFSWTFFCLFAYAFSLLVVLYFLLCLKCVYFKTFNSALHGCIFNFFIVLGGGGLRSSWIEIKSFNGSSMSYFIHRQLCLCLGKFSWTFFCLFAYAFSRLVVLYILLCWSVFIFRLLIVLFMAIFSNVSLYNLDFILLYNFALVPFALSSFIVDDSVTFSSSFSHNNASYDVVMIYVLVFQLIYNICVRCGMAFIEPMYHNKPNISYLLTIGSFVCVSENFYEHFSACLHMFLSRLVVLNILLCLKCVYF